MVLSTSPQSPRNALACSSALVVLRCIIWLVQTCLFMTRKLFVSVFEGILSLNKLLYPCKNLWRAGTGIPSPLLLKQEGGPGTPHSCSSLNSFLYSLLNFLLRHVLRRGPWGAGPTGSPAPKSAPLKELHFRTKKGYLLTSSSGKNPPSTSDPLNVVPFCS